MELSCDERVLKQMNNENIKKTYANSLLSLATGRQILNGSPLTFGEGNVRGRIKNVLNYKKPRFWIVVISIIVVTVVGIGLMANPLSKEGIFNNVLNQDGYTTYEIQKPVTFTAYIESTWIPRNENEVIELNKEIGKVGKVGILLESVMHRGNDIYFNFDVKQFINNDSGEFLYNAILNADGTETSYNLWDAFNIYNNNTKIDVGQRGYGPGSKFSFGINIENYNVIKDGFTLDYKGSILYGYSLEENRRPMVMVNGMLYLDTGKHVPVKINDSAIIGEISSSVDQSEKPTKEGQTNFGSIGSKYAYYDENIVVLINNKWILFERENNIYQLNFSEIDYTRIEKLQLNNINKIIEEKIIDKELSTFIFTDNENGEFKGGINLNGKSYYIGQVSMENTPEDLMGIEEIQVFGKKAVKIYGILGANYAQAFYWFVEEKPEESIIQIDGNTVEIDLDSDDKNEVVATTGTIPETRIYMLKEGKIVVSDINKSIGAKSVTLQDKDKKLFEVYFEPNKPEQYMYYRDSFIKK